MKVFGEKNFLEENNTYTPAKLMSWKEAYKKQSILITNLSTDTCTYKKVLLPDVYDQENIRWFISANVFNIGNKIIRCYNHRSKTRQDRGTIDCYDKLTEKLDFITSIPISERRPSLFDTPPMRLVQILLLENDRFCTVSEETCTIWEANTLQPILVRNNLDKQHKIMISGNLVAYCNDADQVEIWDITEQKCLHLVEMHVHPRLIKELIFNEHLVVVLYDSTPDATGVALFFFNSPTMVGNTKVFDLVNMDLGIINLKALVGSIAIMEVELGMVSCVRLYNLQTKTCLYCNVRHTKIKWTHDNQFLYCNEDDDRMVIIKVDLKTGQVSRMCLTEKPIFDIMLGQDRVMALAGVNLPCSLYIWKKNGELIIHCNDLFPSLKGNPQVNIEVPTFQKTTIRDNILYLEYCAGHAGERRLQFWNLANGKCLLDKELVGHLGTTVVNEIVFSHSVNQVNFYDYQSHIPKIIYKPKTASFALSWFSWFIRKYYSETIFPSSISKA